MKLFSQERIRTLSNGQRDRDSEFQLLRAKKIHSMEARSYGMLRPRDSEQQSSLDHRCNSSSSAGNANKTAIRNAA